jgi:hypothetical protein
MSQQTVEAAIEKIVADPEYAAKVYQGAEEALTSQFDLAPGEWRAIEASLKQDVEDSLGDVQGHTLGRDRFASVSYVRLTALPAYHGSINPNAFGPTIVPSRG